MNQTQILQSIFSVLDILFIFNAKLGTGTLAVNIFHGKFFAYLPFSCLFVFPPCVTHGIVPVIKLEF